MSILDLFQSPVTLEACMYMCTHPGHFIGGPTSLLLSFLDPLSILWNQLTPQVKSGPSSVFSSTGTLGMQVLHKYQFSKEKLEAKDKVNFIFLKIFLKT